MLTNSQMAQFHKLGFVVIDDVLSQEQITSMKKSAAIMVKQHIEQNSSSNKIEKDNKQIFTTNDNNRTNNDFFLDSAEEIRCFFEEDAYDSNGNLVQAPELSINKIGHALHEIDPVFNEISHQKSLGIIAKQLGLADAQIRQSMYIFKQPNIGGVVNWHQDATYIFTTPQSVITFWFAIEDATLENGCLWVEPGGQKGPLKEIFKRDGLKTDMEILDHSPWPDENSGIPIEVKAGTLVCFSGTLPHYSAPNKSKKSRHAYTLHVTDGNTDYSEYNWLQNSKLPLRGFN